MREFPDDELDELIEEMTALCESVQKCAHRDIYPEQLRRAVVMLAEEIVNVDKSKTIMNAIMPDNIDNCSRHH